MKLSILGFMDKYRSLPVSRFLKNGMKTIFVVLCLLGLSGVANAAVTVTAATGGGAIASNTAPGCNAAGTWTALTGPAIAESKAGEIGSGDIVLSAPAGFEFNTSAAVTILLAGSSTASKNINGVANGTPMPATSITATAITFTVAAASKSANTLTWQGIQVRPTAATPLAAGNITETGSSTIAGATAATNFGTLTEVASSPACATAVTIGKTASTSAAVVGDVITFALSASNATGAPLTNVVLTDVLPAGMTYATHAATLGSVGVTGQMVTWTIPALADGGNAQLTLAVTLTQQGSLTNTVTSPGASSASATVLVLGSAVTHFRLDEPAGSWTGAPGEVIDSGGTALHGRRLTTSTPTTTNTVTPVPTISSQYPSVTGGFCNAGQFDGKAVVQVADSTLFDYTTKLSASAWIYPTAYPSSDLYSILSNDTNYEFHLNTAGKLYWWWGASTLTSAATIPLNKWTHIAITLDSSASGGRERIYINGVADTSTNNWKGTLTPNNCQFYIGGDIATGAACSLIPGRNFHGMIDEVKLYSYELSAAEVKADMTLGRSCSGAFDHIQIVHDGEGSICNPETVTVKACLDAACSTLYPGAVTVRLSPTGWVGGDTFTLTGGVATRQLSNGTAGTVTLGTVSVSPTPTNGTSCFNGSTNSCTMNFAAASCAFDAIEPNAAPKTRIYTKLASTAFPLDVVALSSGSTINTAYTGTVTVDLVDSSTSTCPTGAGLNTAQNITFVAGDLGRKKNVSFSNANAVQNARVRMRVGSSAPACSTDNFALRPSAIMLSTTPVMATPPSAAALPIIKAGANFTLLASTSPAAGYAGTLTQDVGKLTAQTTSQDATLQSGGAVGTLTPSSLIVNDVPSNNASYTEVGYLYAAAGTFRDDSFTAVDKNQPGGCDPASTCDCISDPTSGNDLSDVMVGSTGRYGCSIGNKTAVSFGRFIPDHFTVTPGAVTPGCSSAFTYFGQDGFTTGFTLTAQNVMNGTPQNYMGAFAKLNLTNYASYGFSAATLPAGSTLASSSIAPIGTWSNGAASVTAKHQISRPTAPTIETLISISAAPTDGEVPAATATVLGGATKLRYGRLKMQNAYGSELLALPVPLEAQYWTGSYYVTNTADSCTVIPMSSITMGNYLKQLNACETQITPVGNVSMVAGKLPGTGLVLTKPGANNAGSVDLSINLGAMATGNTCVGATQSAAAAANLPWFGTNPGSRATFGIYKTPIIYMRENY